uniref:Spatacsin C-terminal domain-containing protein n=1 Tax=Kalanchoe fedtschenkoi TaxID=63787 RepID=A0A7N0TN62_KALFE
MASPFGGKGPALLQLSKWEPSPVLNFTDFNEAFLSPTRELILLLSCHSEALLLPLVAGDLNKSCNPVLPDLTTSHFSEPHLCKVNSGDNGSYNSDSFTMKCLDECTGKSPFLVSDSHRFISDVNSVAWAASDDTHISNEDCTYKEFLFVSGNHGVTVHAFRQSVETNKMTESCLEVEHELGTWVDWGPSATLAQNTKFSVCLEAEARVIKKSVETMDQYLSEDGNGGLSGNSTPKRWLHSFLSNVETMKSEKNVWTKFPDQSAFPCSANIVSFTIFKRNSVSINAVETMEETAPLADAHSGSDMGSSSPRSKNNFLSYLLDSGMNSPYKCSRVIPSHQINTIGFVLTVVDNSSANAGKTSGRSLSSNLLLIARLHHWGIQWLCCVHLEESQDLDDVVRWADFQLSQDFVACLKASGLIFLYDISTGEYVTHIDILPSCGFSRLSNDQKLDGSLALDDSEGLDMEMGSSCKFQKSNLGDFSKRIFKKLIVASHPSLIAAVDESGIVYVMRLCDLLPPNVNLSESMLSHLQISKFGSLACYEVGGTDISCQKMFPDVSDLQNTKFSALRNNLSDYPSNENQRELGLGGFSPATHIKVPHTKRKVFLPAVKFSEFDHISVSPFGVTRLIKRRNIMGKNSLKIFHTSFQLNTVADDVEFCDSEFKSLRGSEGTVTDEAVGCVFQGCLYLLARDGLLVFLPKISLSPSFLPVEQMSSMQLNVNRDNQSQNKKLIGTDEPWSQWKMEVLDRVLIYECPEEGDRLCLRNGWDIKISRTRRLELALEYSQFNELEQSLESLAHVDLAEEGVLRLIFAAVCLVFHKAGTDGDVSSALRILTVASTFATKMVRKYGICEQKIAVTPVHFFKGSQIHFLPSNVPIEEQNYKNIPRKLREMAYFLEVIRNLQCRLTDKYKRPVRVNGDGSFSSVVSKSLEDSSHPSVQAAGRSLVELSPPDISHNVENSAVMPSEFSFGDTSDLHTLSDVGVGSQGNSALKKKLSFENPKDMMARWELDNSDIKTIVKDALLSGRLPLAVLQLQIQRSKDVLVDKEPYDTFNEIRKVGRSIAYDLFLKGEAGMAVGILQRLGEDIESSLKQLVFGTVRKSLRVQIVEEMRSHGYLGPYEWKMLDRISIIEGLYPSSNFWRTFRIRQEQFAGVSSSCASSRELSFAILHTHLFNDAVITSGDIDGVVLGVWTSLDNSSSMVESAIEDGNTHDGFWAAAVVWSDVWDQKTIDRMILDRSCLFDFHVMWESQFEYHICHNDSLEVCTLLKMVPRNLLSDRSVHIGVDYLRLVSTGETNRDFPLFSNYACSVEEPDATHISIPFVRIFGFPSYDMSSLWLGTLIEVELAKNLIFIREYWEGTAEIMALLAHSGFLIARHKMTIVAEGFMYSSNPNLPFTGSECQADTARALDKLVIFHSMQYNLPNLLDLYLDYTKLIVDEDSCHLFKDSTDNCQWAKWLILIGIKGQEYDASFSNCRSVMSSVSENSASVPDFDEVIQTVDDMAEGGGEMAALATLIYAPVPLQNCLNCGSINRNCSSSAQCTLENLRPALQRFPTLWRTMVAACFGQDATYNLWGPKAKHVTWNSSLLEYLNWRDNIFFSTGHDTSMLQMLPCWFPKSVRRLVQLYVQGPLGWQSLTGFSGEEFLMGHEASFLIDGNANEISAISWEAAIQKQVEQELHDSSLEKTGLGIEHHLHRGRPIAAFNHLLSMRLKKLKLDTGGKGQSVNSLPGPVITQSDVQTLLSPITQDEGSLLSSVMPLAIMHFEDSTLVASCAFLLELCGLSVSLLHVDVTALRRISSFYGSNVHSEQYNHMPDESSAFHGASGDVNPSKSLAQALADDYLHYDGVNTKGSSKSSSGKRSLKSLMHVLQHLEKVSLPHIAEGKTCGTWLSTGVGDGNELRSQQKSASLHWNLVTVFCQMHQIPLSTKYLSVLARDNDWVGFLSESQIGGYPFESIVHVASKDFTDPRLRTHMLTVLKGMQSRRQILPSSNINVPYKKADIPFLDKKMCVPAELFGILADCEKQTSPGQALLTKARDMCWSILALIASCFSDASPLSCLAVWLEITAARETSSIKVNDIASQIASNVGAAVEATNLLFIADRTITFHYNRKSPKRRRLMEPTPGYIGATTSIVSTISDSGILVPEKALSEGELKAMGGEHKIGSKDFFSAFSNMVAILCEQQLFLPLLRAFEIFLPSCSLLPFIRALQAGLFFLKHAESMGKDLPARELHEVLLLSLQWLSGLMTQSNPVYQLHHLREIETRVWLLAVESEAQVKNNGEIPLGSTRGDTSNRSVPNIIDKTASIITRMDSHINATRNRSEKHDVKDYNHTHNNDIQFFDPSFPTIGAGSKSKRRSKSYFPSRRLMEPTERITDFGNGPSASGLINDVKLPDDNANLEVSLSRWEERVEPAELERAVLSLLEFGQITAAKQLQEKLSPTTTPPEFLLVDAALQLAAMSPPDMKVPMSLLDEQVQSVIQSHHIMANQNLVEPLQVLDSLAGIFCEGNGRGLCKRIIAVVKAASVLGLSFAEAFDKQPVELLQLLSLKAQDSFEEAKFLVQTHSIPATNIAQVLAESFLKGLLAAHRGGYMDSQKEEGPAPLLWRFSDFLKWAELCPSEPEIGHSLMRIVITGQEIPHACEVELLILSHHFYKLSACLDGVDVLVELAATRVEAYVMEGDFSCLARLITGVGNFHALNFILGILIENGQLDLLLQKFSAAEDTNTGTAEAVRGFRMAVLTSLKHYNPNDLDAYAMVYNHFDMKHETASLLESRASKAINKWSLRKNKDHNEDLLDSMRFYIEAAEVHSSIDAGNKTRVACAQASLVSLQIRMPDFQWLNLSETNARRALVDQSRFPEALIVAEAYGVNQPGEWTPLFWNLMLKPELLEQFVNEFVAVLPLQPSTLFDLAKFYKSEMQARVDQSNFSVWLTGGGLPADWVKYLWRSFRCLLKRTRDLRTRLQLANAATWHGDVVDACIKIMDKVPDTAGPLILKKGHGGAYLPIM